MLARLPEGEVLAPAGPTARRRPRRPELAGVVAAVWTTVVPAGVRALRVLPDAAVDLVLAGDRLTVAGPDTGPCLEGLPAGRVIGLQLRPSAVSSVLGVPAAAVRDARVPIEELWGTAGRDLLDELAALPSRAAADRLEAACVRRAATNTGLSPVVDTLRPHLATGRPLDVRELGASERHLRRTCTAAYGYGPRTLRRVVRFQAATELLAATGRPPLGEVAYRAGYADQPLLTRDVGEFSGLTPAALRRALTAGAS